MTARGLVLIAEDEEPIAEVVATVVEDAGYTPRLAAHGREALELARAEQPALLITDLMMPHLSGRSSSPPCAATRRPAGMTRCRSS